MSLIDAATSVRENAYAPYSNFKVGAALTAASGEVFAGCNVENVAYPEGTCAEAGAIFEPDDHMRAEAGAIAAMVAAGQTRFTEVAVVADSPFPVTPCGGCRQKLAEFAAPDARITMASLNGGTETMAVADLLPGAFVKSQMAKA